jgi:uncharacterized protein YndB with AHSA1/START domain
MTPPTYPHRLERTVVIAAEPDTVFRFFTDSARWAAWWGAGSTIDPRNGGRVHIRHPNGVEVSGEVCDLVPPNRISFTYGDASGSPIPPGGSRVTIRLEPVAEGTRLHLAHEFVDAAPRDHHIQGWRFQLSLFANVVGDEVFATAATAVDDWFAAWSTTDPAARNVALARVASPAVRFRDKWSLTNDLDDLTAHVAAFHQFMPGLRIEREGDVRRCQDMVMAQWRAGGADGVERGRGTSVFTLHPNGRIESVTGFWNTPTRA